MPTTRFTVTASSWVTSSLRRLHLKTDDLSAFAESHFTDRYVKLIFPKPGVEYPEQIDVRALRGTMPADQLPAVRTYTALHPDATAGTIDIDFVVHGDEGVAGPWAAQAEVGDTLLANGPGGAYRPDPTADWHLLVGDESALPAVAAALESLPDSAVADVVLLVESPQHRPPLTLTAGSTVTYVYRSATAGSGDAHPQAGVDAEPATAGPLETAVRALPWRPGRVHVFAHGEAAEIMQGLRPYLRTERGLEPGQLSISGYWRRGRTEEGFRQWKAEFARKPEQTSPR